MTIRWLNRRSQALLPDLAVPEAPAETATENPYLNARRTWNEHVGTLVSGRNTWQLIGAASLVLLLLAVAGLVYIGSQSRFIPYVIEVDKQGQTLSVGPVTRSAESDARLIHATLADFVSDFRMVTPDYQLQRKAIFRIYAHLVTKDPATAKMSEFMREGSGTNPFERAADEMVSTRVLTVIPQSPDTWQVEWEETTRDRQGTQKADPAFYRALITVYVSPPTGEVNDEQLRNNPFGIYVRDFSFSPLPAINR